MNYEDEDEYIYIYIRSIQKFISKTAVDDY